MERRKNTRIPFNLESVIRHEGKTAAGTVLNICLQGMFISAQERFEAHSIVDVELRLEFGGARRLLRVPGEVVRHDSDGTAIKLMKMDLDSYITIRDLMMERSDDPGALMDEFCDFISEHPLS